MESDRGIVRHLPGIVAEVVMEVTRYITSDVIITGLGAIMVGYLTYRAGKHVYIRRKVAGLYRGNQEMLTASKARIEKLLERQNPEELATTAALPWDQLVDRLQSGSVSAMTSLRAYQAAAIKVQDKTNAVVAWIEDAEAQAQRLDDLPKEERGPLHGVPVSIKECYDVAGTYSTSGLAILAREKVEEDCPAVKLIKSLGGIPFCKTNVPQAMMSLQCSNPIYGTTENPHMKGREVGGSSGGEGALIGGGGSILGLGSDVGGSLRNPPAFCGAYSLKPTEGRHMSQLGVAPYISFLGINVVGGWIAESGRALEAAWRAVWAIPSPQTFDTKLVPVPWDEESYLTKPRIGYYAWDNFLLPAPGCQRAVTEAVSVLRSLGYTLVPLDPPDIEKVMYYFNGIILSDLNAGMYKDLDYDLYDSTLNGLVAAVTVYKLPWFIKKFLINPILSLLTRLPAVENMFVTSAEMSKNVYKRDQFTREYLDQMTKAGVDLILCPAQLLPAPPTGVMGTFVAPVLPYIPWNLMNFPAGIAPFTTWTEQDTASLSSYPRDDLVYKMIHSYCDGAVGLPIAVQVVGRPYKDEQVLKVLTDLDSVKM